ncbi:MAG TPA: hypothetical protein VFH08_12575 [Chitinophagaceae bacterium]|nr:hypothetical protein [Chitinophagaceae bacterium]
MQRILVILFILAFMIGCKKNKEKPAEDAKQPYEGYFLVKRRINTTQEAYLAIGTPNLPQDTLSIYLDTNNDPWNENTWKFSAAGIDQYLVSPYYDTTLAMMAESSGVLLIRPRTAFNRKMLFAVEKENSSNVNLVKLKSVESGQYLTLQFCEKGWWSWEFKMRAQNDCPLLNIVADTCFCAKTFELVRQ